MAEMKKNALSDWKARKAGEKSEEKAEKQYYKTHKVGYKRTAGDVIFDVLNYTFFITFTIICIFPFYYLFFTGYGNAAFICRFFSSTISGKI